VLASLFMGEDSKSKKEVEVVLFACLLVSVCVSLGYSLLLLERKDDVEPEIISSLPSIPIPNSIFSMAVYLQ
jgi:hypothetical protein